MVDDDVHHTRLQRCWLDLGADSYRLKPVSMPTMQELFCYTLQNFLWYFALSNLDPITAAVTSQMKVMTTAVASVLMLEGSDRVGGRLKSEKWDCGDAGSKGPQVPKV